MGDVLRDLQKDELSPGAFFADRYQIEDILGRGGMGTVYRARDLSLGEPIALKLLSFGAEPPPVAVLRFRQEVKLARRVTHPHVARVYDIGEHEGQIFLTMELITGGTLRALIKRERRLGPGRALSIARALTEGLAAAHKAGVIHRDLKPTNVLLDHDGRVVLTDFGIARSLQEELTLTVGAIGTPQYMAPEQAYGGPVDARTDLYALGRIILEMLTGERAEIEPERLTEALLRQGVAPAFIALTLSCLEFDPGARPRSADEVARALAEIPLDAADEAITGIRPVATPDAQDPKSVPGDATQPMPPSFPEVTAEGPRALAVLPFLYRGSKETDYFGDAITDELVDVLSRTRSLRVLGTGATARYRQERDPRVVGRELAVFAVIDGAVQILGTRVRLSVRLIDAESGAQLWSDHHEGSLEDLFAFQEAIAQQVAEELRVEITAITHRGDAPAVAIEHYLSARRRLRNFDFAGATTAVEGFAQCISLAPAFAPAFAAHAVASVRAWYFEPGKHEGPDWEQEAAASVARALERAPELAETHLAAGIHATQYGDYPAAVRALTQTLAIAPTCAYAHEHLGMIECEAGRWEPGARRLKIAFDLDPEMPYPLAFLARTYALHRRDDACDETLDRLEQRGGVSRTLATTTRVRVLVWRGDHAAAKRILDNWIPARGMILNATRLYAKALFGAIDDQQIEQHFTELNVGVSNRRRLTHVAQLIAEIFASRGSLDMAGVYLTRAASLLLLDLEWLDHCPLLAPLRPLPVFIEARRLVLARVDAITHL
jgi:serine/threonine protein kinase/tetratricopeptide (TPR) repeat protein